MERRANPGTSVRRWIIPRRDSSDVSGAGSALLKGTRQVSVVPGNHCCINNDVRHRPCQSFVPADTWAPAPFCGNVEMAMRLISNIDQSENPSRLVKARTNWDASFHFTGRFCVFLPVHISCAVCSIPAPRIRLMVLLIPRFEYCTGSGGQAWESKGFSFGPGNNRPLMQILKGQMGWFRIASSTARRSEYASRCPWQSLGDQPVWKVQTMQRKRPRNFVFMG